MEKKGSNSKITYEDFEPNFKWTKEGEKDTLEIQVEGFKMEHLKVQVNSLGAVLVKGERSLDDKKLKRLRFSIEFKLEKEHNSNGIRAKLGHGILHIIVPKLKDNYTTSPQQPTPNNSQETNEKQKPDHNSNMLLSRRFGVSNRNRALWFTVMVVGVATVGITAYLSYKYWFLAGEGISRTGSDFSPPP